MTFSPLDHAGRMNRYSTVEKCLFGPFLREVYAFFRSRIEAFLTLKIDKYSDGCFTDHITIAAYYPIILEARPRTQHVLDHKKYQRLATTKLESTSVHGRYEQV